MPYHRERLAAGIEKACYKRPISATRLGKLVESVEDELYKTFDKEVDSSEIGHLASEHLKRIDQIAYVRYASVYKQFPRHRRPARRGARRDRTRRADGRGGSGEAVLGVASGPSRTQGPA